MCVADVTSFPSYCYFIIHLKVSDFAWFCTHIVQEMSINVVQASGEIRSTERNWTRRRRQTFLDIQEGVSISKILIQNLRDFQTKNKLAKHVFSIICSNFLIKIFREGGGIHLDRPGWGGGRTKNRKMPPFMDRYKSKSFKPINFFIFIVLSKKLFYGRHSCILSLFIIN